MGLSQELSYQEQPQRRVLPKKPHQPRMLPRKPDEFANVWDDQVLPWSSDDMLNTPPMEEFDIPTTVEDEEDAYNWEQEDMSTEEATVDITVDVNMNEPPPKGSSILAAHQPLLTNDLVSNQWGVTEQGTSVLFDCVSPMDAEGITYTNFKMPMENEFKMPMDTNELPTEGLFDPEDVFGLGKTTGDLLLRSMEESEITEEFMKSGIDTNLNLGFVTVPEPMPSTSQFIHPSDDLTTTNPTPILASAATQEDTTDRNDPDWKPERPVQARKTVIQAVRQKPLRKKQPGRLITLDPAAILALAADQEDATNRDDPEWTPPVPEQPAVPAIENPHLGAQETRKRKPGRPERILPYVITQIPSARSNSRFSQEEIDGKKYRRQRDLNNQASKLCRTKRKNKEEEMEKMLLEEQKKNENLKMMLKKIEQQVASFRKLQIPT